MKATGLLPIRVPAAGQGLLGATALAIALVGVAACWLPTLRAARARPTDALRTD